MNCPDCPKIYHGSCKSVGCPKFIVRNNLMTVENYTPYCGIEVNRDYNGARGIFLKNVSLALAATPSLSESSNCISKQLVTSC